MKQILVWACLVLFTNSKVNKVKESSWDRIFSNIEYTWFSLTDVQDPSDISLDELATLPVDQKMSFEEMVIGHGFEVESHFITTKDGYIN